MIKIGVLGDKTSPNASSPGFMWLFLTSHAHQVLTILIQLLVEIPDVDDNSYPWYSLSVPGVMVTEFRRMWFSSNEPLFRP